MLPGASYDDVCVRVRRAHTGERPRCVGEEKRFERDRLFSPGFTENRWNNATRKLREVITECQM